MKLKYDMRALGLLMIMTSFIIIPAHALSPLWISSLTGTDQNITSFQDTDSHFLNYLAISEDGKNIVTGTYDGSIYFINETGAVLWNKTALYDTSYTNSLRLSSNGNYIAFSDSGSAPASNPPKKIGLMNKAGEALWNYSARTFIFHSAISSNGSRSVFGSHDNISCFDINGSFLWNHPVKSPVTSLDISEDGVYTIAATEQGPVVCLNISGSVLWEHEFSNVNEMKISGDGNYICISGDSFRTLYYLDNKGEILWNRTMPDTDVVICELSHSGDNIVVRTTGAVSCYDRYGNPKWQYNTSSRQPLVHTLSPQIMSLSKNGSYSVIATGQSFILLNKTGYETGNFSCEDSISGVDISYDGSDIVAINNKKLFFFRNPDSERGTRPGFIKNEMQDFPKILKIEIDPLNQEYYAGDMLIVSGNTTLAEGEDIRVLFYRNAFVSGMKIRPEKTSTEVMTKVVTNKSGFNRWSAAINTTGFWAGENIVAAYCNKDPGINSGQKVVLISKEQKTALEIDEK
ncbi:WD40 repeat domain-containing protein [Methanochimaera problematica]|nr:PQQ-binding-like beta-propeller repeat protein [Methanoplanus sp. FWC-SCC4]